MKKLICIFLIVFVTLFSLGGFLIYSAYLSCYKNSYKSFIKTNQHSKNYKKIFINPSELYVNTKTIIWEDEYKEVIIDGVLYDIVSVNYENGKVMLTVISDNQEQEIKKQFASQYSDSYAQSSNHLAKLLKQFLGLKFLSNYGYSNNSNKYYSSISYTPYSLLKNKFVFLPQELPPPNFHLLIFIVRSGSFLSA